MLVKVISMFLLNIRVLLISKGCTNNENRPSVFASKFYFYSLTATSQRRFRIDLNQLVEIKAQNCII